MRSYAACSSGSIGTSLSVPRFSMSACSALPIFAPSIVEAALKAGYGPTISAAAVKKLVDSVVSYQERSIGIIAEMRKLSTQNSAEIRDAVEDGKRRLALLVEQGAAAALTVRTS